MMYLCKIVSKHFQQYETGNIRNVRSQSKGKNRIWNLQCVDDAGNITENRQEDVDEEIGIAPSFEKDTEGRKDDGEDDFADVAKEGEKVSMISLV